MASVTVSPEGALEDSIAPDTQVTPADAKHAEKLLERAVSAMERGDYSGAAVAARQSLSLVPSAAGQLLLSKALRAQGNADGAKRAVEQARALAGDDSNLLQQVDRQATLLGGVTAAPLSASLDTPLPPTVPAAKPAAGGASYVAALDAAAAPPAPVTGTPRAGLASWKYALVLVTAFLLMFCTVYAVRRRAVEPPTVINTVEVAPAPDETTPEDTGTGAPTPAAPEAPAASNEEEAPSPPPETAAPQPTTAPVEQPRAAAPAPVSRPAPHPTAAEVRLPPPVAPQNNAGGTSSGNGMLRVPSVLPTPVAVDSPQVPTIRTPRP